NFIDRTQIAGSGWNLAQIRLSPRIALHVAARDDAFDLFQPRPLRQERRRTEIAAAVDPVIGDAPIGRSPERIAFELDGDAERRAGLIRTDVEIDVIAQVVDRLSWLSLFG